MLELIRELAHPIKEVEKFYSDHLQAAKPEKTTVRCQSTQSLEDRLYGLQSKSKGPRATDGHWYKSQCPKVEATGIYVEGQQQEKMQPAQGGRIREKGRGRENIFSSSSFLFHQGPQVYGWCLP